MDRIIISRAQPDELAKVRMFYTQVGYANTNNIKDTDLIFGAMSIIIFVGVVRLVREHNVNVLRGMQVHPDYQKKGIGSQLLLALEKEIPDTCYCLAHEWLENFYGKIGFKRIDDADLPAFLQQRLHKYRTTEYPTLIGCKRA